METTKKCPYCGSTIKFDAIKCRFCREDLGLDNESTINDEKYVLPPEIRIPKMFFDKMVVIIVILIISTISACILLHYYNFQELIAPTIRFGSSVIFVYLCMVLYFFIRHFKINALYYSGLAMVFSLYSLLLFTTPMFGPLIIPYVTANSSEYYWLIQFIEVVLFIVTLIILLLITVQLFKFKPTIYSIKVKNIGYAFIFVTLLFFLNFIQTHMDYNVLYDDMISPTLIIFVAIIILFFVTYGTIKDTVKICKNNQTIPLGSTISLMGKD